MKSKEMGSFLRSKRNELRLSSIEIAERIGCNRTTIERWEKGEVIFPRSKVGLVARAYEIGQDKFSEIFGYHISTTTKPDSLMTVSVEDFEFLIGIARGLTKPMSLITIRELLKCRHE